ncbi:zinc-ribbon domain-containing protein [Methylobacterium sp. Leaf118]|uniref:zinc-ribbon domain-containing protein n=1 Tax=Methylobacterium sp. Leaf118 TaxID=2876562 RepID=UPI001E3358B3|nr:zinc-ribbon domain-containing protein [Methylobacterium sp. Leaf118]
MLIVCPACASEYRIDAERVGASGRSVRCAACRETWFISPNDVAAGRFDEMAEAEADPFAGPAAEPAPEAPQGPIPEEPPAESPPPRPRAGTGKRKTTSETTTKTGRPAARRFPPALAAGLAVAALLPLVLLGRASVVRAMPQTAGIFSGIGLGVNLRGIDLVDVAAFQVPAEGANPARLVVEGDLVGVARERVTVPPVEVELRDEHGQPLYRWSVPGPRAALEPGERARFTASLSAPPAQGRSVEVRFATAPASEAAPRPDETP